MEITNVIVWMLLSAPAVLLLGWIVVGCTADYLDYLSRKRGLEYSPLCDKIVAAYFVIFVKIGFNRKELSKKPCKYRKKRVHEYPLTGLGWTGYIVSAFIWLLNFKTKGPLMEVIPQVDMFTYLAIILASVYAIAKMLAAVNWLYDNKDHMEK
ncbi:hypothetical protein GR28A_00061 [Vibrio phage vB_VcorM_GR28A]|nr:hypothetical protein GR28A_00061 [Vibrio phage vB_VcorM_GR28A]